MTAFPEYSALCDRELDARIDLARQLSHPALSGLLQERLRRTKAKLNLAWSMDPDRTTRRESDVGREEHYRGGPSIDWGGR